MGNIKTKKPSDKFYNFRKSKLSTLAGAGDVPRGIGSVDVFDLRIADIDSYEKQARRVFNEEEIEGLAQSIDEVGIINPIQVIKLEEEGKFAVVNGERRLRAAQKLGLEKIPCIILTNNERTELISVIDNIQREDLHPVELADAFSSLSTDYGDKKLLAKKLGVPYTSLVETTKLSRLPQDVKRIILDKDIRSRAVFRELFKHKTAQEMLSFLSGREKTTKFKKATNKLRFTFEFDSAGGVTVSNIPKSIKSVEEIDSIINALQGVRKNMQLD